MIILLRLGELGGDIVELGGLSSDIKAWLSFFHHHYHYLQKIMFIDDYQLQSYIGREINSPQPKRIKLL